MLDGSTDISQTLNRSTAFPQGDGQHSGGASYVTGGTVVKQDLGEIDVTGMARERIRKKKAGIVDDSGPGSWAPPPKQEDPVPPKVALKRVERARQAAERKALKELDAAALKGLMRARGEVGRNRQQQIRLQRYDASTAPLAADWWQQQQQQQHAGVGEDEDDEKREERAPSPVPGEGPRRGGWGSENDPIVRNENVGGSGVGGKPSEPYGRPRGCCWGGGGEPLPARGAAVQQGQAYDGGDRGGEEDGGGRGAPREEEEAKPGKLDRHQEAAKRRAEKEEAKKEQLKRKLAEKERRQSGGLLAIARNAVAAANTSGAMSGGGAGGDGGGEEWGVQEQPAEGRRAEGGGGGEEERLRGELEEAEGELKAGGVSEARTLTLRKRVAACRAGLLRAERAREEERRRVQKRTQAIAEASRRERELSSSGGGGGEGRWGGDEAEAEQGNVSTYVSQPDRGRGGGLEGPRLIEPQHGRRARSGPPPVPSPAQIKAPAPAQIKAPVPAQNKAPPRPRVEAGGGGGEAGWGGVGGTRVGLRASQEKGPAAGRGQCGKGLSDEVVAMLMEDAEAMCEVLSVREMRRCIEAWRREVDMATMSLRGR